MIHAKAAREPEAQLLDLAGKSVVIVGRLESLDRPTARALVNERGGTIGRTISRRTAFLVVGYDCAGLVASGTLQARIAAADSAAVPCLSESGFVRALHPDGDACAGGASPKPPTMSPRPFGLDDIAKTARLPIDVLRLLVLLDIIELHADGGDFTALAAARQAARLLNDGTSLAELIDTVRRLRNAHRLDASHPLAQHRFDVDEQQRLALRLGSRLAETDGQLRLDLGAGAAPAFDELMSAARAAEVAANWSTAETLYRRCVDLAPNDPVAPFNLGNVLRELNRPREAALWFQLALARDRTFAAAWYNLAHLAEAAGDLDMARDRLERATACDPTFADAAFNLARLHYAAGAYDRAATAWQHYLDLDHDSEWARKARHGIALCRQHLRVSSSGG